MLTYWRWLQHSKVGNIHSKQGQQQQSVWFASYFDCNVKITDFDFTVFPSFQYADDEKRLLSGIDYDGASTFMIDRRYLLKSNTFWFQLHESLFLRYQYAFDSVILVYHAYIRKDAQPSEVCVTTDTVRHAAKRLQEEICCAGTWISTPLSKIIGMKSINNSVPIFWSPSVRVPSTFHPRKGFKSQKFGH